MIEAVHAYSPNGARKEMARCVCDQCGATAEVPAAHGNHNRFDRSGAPKKIIANHSQVITKIQGQGWSIIRNRLLCVECSAAKKATKPQSPNPNQEQEPQMTATLTKTAPVSDLRQPTREQRRAIMDMLGVTYDTKAERYSGTDTDKTVAEAIGGGIMPGWVAEIREEFFGPCGSNDEMAALIADIRCWQAKTEKARLDAAAHQAKTNTALAAMDDARAKVADMLKRVEAIKAAVGPKAARC